jgi:P-type E1-E2 ATPase
VTAHVQLSAHAQHIIKSRAHAQVLVICLQVMPGARIAVDGNVTAGHSYVDESMLTGETAAVPKSPGDSLMGGTLNTGGTLHMRCERVSALLLITRSRNSTFEPTCCSIRRVWELTPCRVLS